MHSYQQPHLESDFVAGNFAELIARTFDSGQRVDSAMLPSIIGSLAFIGRQAEAVALLGSQENELNPLAKTACNFFIGIGWVRQTRYKRAFQVFKKNQIELHDQDDKGSSNHNNESESCLRKFYVYQGISFYLFYRGDFSRSYHYATRAFKESVASQELFARILAMDILGHNQVSLGAINEGFGNLLKAAQLAKTASNEALADTIQLALSLYRAQYGYDSKNALDTLLEMRQKQNYSDSYSYADLSLEISRQRTLRGQFQEAKELLDEISLKIVTAHNRRQEITLQLRQAELAYQRGDYADALFYLQNARRCLHLEVDRTYELQILGLEMKCLVQVKSNVGLEEKKREMLAVSQKFHNHIHCNILRRQGVVQLEAPLKQKNSQDKLGHLLELISKNEVDLVTLNQTGYLTFIYDMLKISRGRNVLFLGHSKNIFLSFSKFGIKRIEPAPTDLMRKILLALSTETELSKEKLFKIVWGLKYTPHRHDSLIYTTMSNLRKCLGPDAASWLETLDIGYRMKCQIIFQDSDVNSNENLNSETNNSAFSKISRDIADQIELKDDPNYMRRRVNGHGSEGEGDAISELSNNASKLSGESQDVADGKKLRSQSDSQVLNLILRRYSDKNLNFRQIKIIKYLYSHDSLGTKQYAQLENIKEITACRDLTDLYQKNILIRVGKARATRYMLNRRFLEGE